ncbi:MAG TPA: cytochrome c, partial [Gemmatimonadaceae bacterium]
AAMVADPQGTVPGSLMPRVAMPDATRELLVRYLVSRADSAAAVGAPDGASASSSGAPAREASPRAAPSPAPAASGPRLDSGAAVSDSNTAARAQTAAGVGERPDGAALYALHCAACHGTRGRGDGPNAARLPVPPAVHASREAMSRRSDDALFDTIYGGGAVMNRSPRMPPYGETLSRAEIWALVRHIRTLCRCEGPAWSRDGRSGP